MNIMPYSQLPLEIGLRETSTFQNFVAGENQAAVSVLESGQEPFVFLVGIKGTGKSHLLQASCHALRQKQQICAYLPLAQDSELEPEILEGLESASLICLDDINAIAGNQDWETALFHLYNRVRDAGGRLLASADQVPTGAGFQLADLTSRLSWGPVFKLRFLSDQNKLLALQQRAATRGLELNREVGEYLLRRSSRDMVGLFDLLETLDRESLAAKRRLTIPFVREWL